MPEHFFSKEQACQKSSLQRKVGFGTAFQAAMLQLRAQTGGGGNAVGKTLHRCLIGLADPRLDYSNPQRFWEFVGPTIRCCVLAALENITESKTTTAV